MTIHWLDEHAYGQDDAPSRSVIRPANAARADRWRDVLAWYGAREGSAAAVPDPGAHVVSLGGAFDRAARHYARRLGRPLVIVDSTGGLAAELRAATSVTLFAPPSQLTLPTLHALADALAVPWGVVTGADLAACSFVVAKLLSSPPSTEVVAWVSGCFRQCGAVNGERADALPFSRDAVLWLLRDRGARAAVLVAHGEGAHVNLRDVVLCGAQGDEHALDGRPLRGCGPSRCKRVHRADVEVLGWHELRASSLAVLSCNGFSVAGEQYPSTSSAVLSSLEGFARELVVTDRTVLLVPAEGRSMARVLAAGAPLAHLARWKNDAESRREGRGPYVFVGDPAAATSYDGRLALPSLPDGGARVVELVGRSPATVVRAFGCAFCLEDGDPALALRSGDELLERAERALAVLAERSGRAEQLENATRLRYAGVPHAAAIHEAVAELADLRARIGLRAVALGAEVARALGRGVWESAGPSALLAQIEELVATWDARCAELAAEHLTALPMEELFDHGLLRQATHAGTCARCHIETTVTEHGLGPARPRVVTERCPVCGFLGAFGHGGGRLVLDGAPELVPGSFFELTVRIDGAETAALRAPGVLHVRVRDKGTGETVWTTRTTSPLPAVVQVPVPAAITADLHTLHAVHVAGLAVSMARIRRPAFTHVSVAPSAGAPLSRCRPTEEDHVLAG